MERLPDLPRGTRQLVADTSLNSDLSASKAHALFTLPFCLPERTVQTLSLIVYFTDEEPEAQKYYVTDVQSWFSDKARKKRTRSLKLGTKSLFFFFTRCNNHSLYTTHIH